MPSHLLFNKNILNIIVLFKVNLASFIFPGHYPPNFS